MSAIAIPAARPRLFMRQHSRRAFHLKGLVTLTFIATLVVDAFMATHIALVGNLIWLWVDFE